MENEDDVKSEDIRYVQEVIKSGKFCKISEHYGKLELGNCERDMLPQTSKYSEKGGELDICVSILYL